MTHRNDESFQLVGLRLNVSKSQVGTCIKSRDKKKRRKSRGLQET